MLRDVSTRTGTTAPRDAAGGRHHEDIHIAVVLAREGDGLAIRGEERGRFGARSVGEACGNAAAPRDRPQVAGVGEDNLILAHRGTLQEVQRACRAE